MPAKLTTSERARKAARDRWSKPENAQRRAERLAERIHEVAATDPDGWAERLAASLPPLTASEAAGIGKLAAVLDARRATSNDGGRDAAA